MAHHLVRAGRESEAVPLLRDAANWAAEVGAYRDGLAWAELALEHADAEARSDLLALRADLCLGAGDPRAASAYRIAIDCAPAEQAPALRVRQARAQLAGGDVDGAAEALATAQPRTHRDRASLLVWRGIVAWHRGDLDDARRCAAEAETLGSEAVRVTELRALLAHADGRFDHHAQLELSESWRDPELAGRVFDAYLCVTERVLGSGEPVEQLALFAKRLRVEARQAGALRGESFAATVLGEAELLTGNVAVARDLLVEGARLSREAGSAGAEALARLRLGEALLHLGDRAAASVQLDEALELAHVPTLARHLLFLVYGVLVQIPDDPAETLGVVDRAEQLFDPRWLCRTCPLDFWLGAATAAARAGDHERADGYVTRVRNGAGAWQRGPVRAVLAEAEGELLLARGVGAEGRARLALAVDGYAAAGHRLREARARATLASS